MIIGEWGSAYETAFPVDLLVRNAARLDRLRALFIGEMNSEQCEISWIQQGDITACWRRSRPWSTCGCAAPTVWR